MSSSPDLFTTLRYIPSGDWIIKRTDVPLFDLHVDRLKQGVERFGELDSTRKEDKTDRNLQVWRALERIIMEKGIEKGMRVSSESVSHEIKFARGGSGEWES